MQGQQLIAGFGFCLDGMLGTFGDVLLQVGNFAVLFGLAGYVLFAKLHQAFVTASDDQRGRGAGQAAEQTIMISYGHPKARSGFFEVDAKAANAGKWAWKRPCDR